MALKSNLLYDALLVPNIGIEVPIGDRWSVSAAWMYAWWSNDHRHKSWRIYGGELEGRYWLPSAGTKPLQRHHVGIYTQMVMYDLKWGERGYMGGRPGSTIWCEGNYGAGVSYGYSLPISSIFQLDFTIGVGFLGGLYREYYFDDDCYVYDRTRRMRYWGPTKAEVSLVWLIPYGKKQKGGKL